MAGSCLRPVEDGVELIIRVVPNARRTEVDGMYDGALRVRLKAPPVEGAANRELATFIASQLGVSRRAVSLVRGEKSRSKTVRIIGVSSDTVKGHLLPQS